MASEDSSQSIPASTEAPTPLKTRLTCLDETRALAICAMIGAHFAPALFARVPTLQPWETPVFFACRFATPAFIFVFGVTVGFVYFEKYRAGKGDAIRKTLMRRAILLAACVLIIRSEFLVGLLLARETDPTLWLMGAYSILTYYMFAVLSVPMWLRALKNRPVRNGLLLGSVHWLIGIAVAQYLWPRGDPRTYAEVFRCFVFSGGYAYFELSGTALLAIPLGVALKRSVRNGRQTATLAAQFGIGAALTLAGFAAGLASGEFSVDAIAEGALKAPPRLWYFTFFSGQALMTLAVLGLLTQRFQALARALYPVQLFGQASLPIYTSHALVLPGVAFLTWALPGPDALGDIGAFGLFCLFCLFQMWRKHRKMMGLPPLSKALLARRPLNRTAEASD